MDRLSRETIEAALQALNEELVRRGVKAQLYLVGGAVMCLVYQARTATRDVDGWFSEPQVVRAAAREVADALSLPEDWLNDAAKGFIPQGAGFDSWRALSHLEVSVADTRTLLAMKCAAARTTEDAADIRFLADHLGLASSSEVLEVVLAFYPPDRLPVRTRLLLEEMFDDRD